MDKENTLRLIHKMKHSSFGDTMIDCVFGDIRYKLVLMTAECADDSSLMDLLGRWRKENEQWFLSQFPVTVERTTKWFSNGVINAEDRLLFLMDIGGRYIGHVGLYRFDFENSSCEIDNIVRGESSHPGIMGAAVNDMMKWGVGSLKLKSYALRVLSDNERALKLYRKLGFREFKRTPLVYKEGNDGPELAEDDNAQKDKIVKYFVSMKVDMDEK